MHTYITYSTMMHMHTVSEFYLLWSSCGIFYSYPSLFAHVILTDISKCTMSTTLSAKYNQIWWLHQMETFSALLAHCEGNPCDTTGFPSQKPVTRSLDIFLDVRLKKKTVGQTVELAVIWGAVTSMWRHCNELTENTFCVERWTLVKHHTFCPDFTWMSLNI